MSMQIQESRVYKLKPCPYETLLSHIVTGSGVRVRVRARVRVLKCFCNNTYWLISYFQILIFVVSPFFFANNKSCNAGSNNDCGYSTQSTHTRPYTSTLHTYISIFRKDFQARPFHPLDTSETTRSCCMSKWENTIIQSESIAHNWRICNNSRVPTNKKKFFWKVLRKFTLQSELHFWILVLYFNQEWNTYLFCFHQVSNDCFWHDVSCLLRHIWYHLRDSCLLILIFLDTYSFKSSSFSYHMTGELLASRQWKYAYQGDQAVPFA